MPTVIVILIIVSDDDDRILMSCSGLCSTSDLFLFHRSGIASLVVMGITNHGSNVIDMTLNVIHRIPSKYSLCYRPFMYI